MRVDLTPKLEISSNAWVRVSGFARSTGASNVIDCECEACAAAGRTAATSAQSARMDGAILLMSGWRRALPLQPIGGGEGFGGGRNGGAPRRSTLATRFRFAMPVAQAPDDVVRTRAEAAANDRPPLLIVEPLRAFLDEHGLGTGDLV